MAPRGSPWETLVGPIFALGPSQGVPKEPREPILSHLGRVPCSTLILDPQNRQKSSISKVPEPRKLHWRLDGSAIFTFSQISCLNPKIIDLGPLLAAFWEPFGSYLASWEFLGALRALWWAPKEQLCGTLFSPWYSGWLFYSKTAPRGHKGAQGQVSW